MITLITSRMQKCSPDLALLQNFEQFCSKNSSWNTKKGPLLFAPRALSSRLYTAMHTVLEPLLGNYKRAGAVISLGLPYHNYLYAKTFPYYTMDCDLKVLWTYDVWEPDYPEVERLVRKSGVNMLLLSSYQATEHFKNLNISGCEVKWIPETIDTSDYKVKSWDERSIDVLSFGRSWLKYHNRIVDGCESSGINYVYQERSAGHDVAVNGLRKNLQFPTWDSFVEGLSDSKICICFPRCMTHPALAGNVSTLTIRYLQAMASKCLILGSAPLDVKHLFDYNPVIEVDWTDPAGQIRSIIENPERYYALIDKNYNAVSTFLHHKSALFQIDGLVRARLGIDCIEKDAIHQGLQY